MSELYENNLTQIQWICMHKQMYYEIMFSTLQMDSTKLIYVKGNN
jgi:hypothetical protein